MEVHENIQDSVIKTISKKKICKKAKCLSQEALQTAEKRREAKDKGEKQRYARLNAEFQRLARLPQGSMQRNRGKQQNGKD